MPVIVPQKVALLSDMSSDCVYSKKQGFRENSHLILDHTTTHGYSDVIVNEYMLWSIVNERKTSTMNIINIYSLK